MNNPVQLRCPSCKSANIARDGSAAWDESNQDWSLKAVYDNGFCDDCGTDRISCFDEEPVTLNNITKYLQEGGVKCPVPGCECEQIEGGPVNIDAGVAWQEVSCTKCNAIWKDRYQLIAVDMIEQ